MRGSRELAGALVTLALLAGFSLAPPAHAAFPGQNGKIVFIGPISTANPDGTGETRLRSAHNSGTSPAWSADGRKIVYQQGTQSRLMNFDGSGDRPVVANGRTPTFSPDGTKVVFSRPDSARSFWALFTVRVDGTGETQLTPFFNTDLEPVWSPNGARIAFARNGDIYTINADGSVPTNLSNDPNSTDRSPDWSPDGSRIVFRRDGHIWVMNADGRGKARIAGPGNNPVWSPDGSKVAYASGGIRVMNPDGSNETTVIDGSDPDWQPCSGACPTSSPTPYDAPSAAGRLQVRLVPSFRKTISDFQCQARGGAPSTHAAPLSFPSCNPPSFAPGTSARLGAFAEGGITYTAHADTGFGIRLKIEGGLSDVQTAAGGDYTGDLTVVSRLRLSDRFSGPALNEAATVADFDFAAPADCAPDPEPDLGSFCGVSTTADALMPESIRWGRRSVIQIFQVRAKDAGANGVLGDSDDRDFARQGLFVP